MLNGIAKERAIEFYKNQLGIIYTESLPLMFKIKMFIEWMDDINCYVIISKKPQSNEFTFKIEQDNGYRFSDGTVYNSRIKSEIAALRHFSDMYNSHINKL